MYRRLVTKLDHFQKEKVSNAKQAYERVAQEKWEVLNGKYYDLKDRQELERDPDIKEAIGRKMKAIQKEMDGIEDYKPEMNRFTVLPWVKLHKKLQDMLDQGDARIRLLTEAGEKDLQEDEIQ